MLPLESWFLRFKTTLPELYQNYLANDFSLKMAHGEDTCLHSITAAKYQKIKTSFYCTQEFRASEETGCIFHLSYQ